MSADRSDHLDFVFLEPGRLVEGDLELVLVERYGGDPTRGLVPSYIFEMRKAAKGRRVGNVDLPENTVAYLRGERQKLRTRSRFRAKLARA
jgi:hypothetical protein